MGNGIDRNLLLELSVAGGMPPVTSELLRVYQDGRAVGLIGNAWPEGQPQDEAGLYAVTLSSAELTHLKQMLSEVSATKLSGEYGPVHADSGYTQLVFGYESTVTSTRWGTFARVPESLASLRGVLRKTLAKVRTAGLQTVKLELEVKQLPAANNGGLRLGFVFTNTGSQAVSTQLIGKPSALGDTTQLRLYAVSTEEDKILIYQGMPPLDFFYKSTLVELTGSDEAPGTLEPVVLAPKEKRHLGTKVELPLGKSILIYGFAEPYLEISFGNQTLELPCLVISKPVSVEI